MVDDPFGQLEFFHGLHANQLKLLQGVFNPVEFDADTRIFEQGEPAHHLYIVVSGEIVVNFKPDDGPSIQVARVHKGGVVGWSAALSSRTYTSSAQSTQYTQALQVSSSDLRHLCRAHPDIASLLQDRLAAVIVERVRITHAQVVALLELGLGTPASTLDR